MVKTRWRAAATGATILMLGQLALAAPVGAVAAGPFTVTADMPSARPAGRLWTFNDFFPRTVTVRTGSDLTFINQGFHTFTILPAGTTARQDWHGNGLATDDTDDTGLNPNGTTHGLFNVPALGPTSMSCGWPGAACGFAGSAVVSSGAPFGPPGPFVVHVTAPPGTYVFVCRIHAGMSGTLKVVPAGARTPSPKQVEKQVEKQVKQDLKGAWAADAKANHEGKSRNKDGSATWRVTAGTSSADGHVALLEFFPRNVDAMPGDKVVFTPRSPNEPHTVTFPGDLMTEFAPLCETPAGDELAIPNHLPPQGPLDFHCGLAPFPDEIELDGGNAVWHVTTPTTVSDSGIIGPRRLAKDVGMAKTAILNKWTVSFAGAATGTYTYVCQIHDGMEGTITVH